ncbi:MAG: hypothetical protein J6R37_02460 [Clostridia bacterium]|nr:hypothetical protein [Clostridia bacterium]
MAKFFALVKTMFLNQQRAMVIRSNKFKKNPKGVSTWLILCIVFAPLLALMAIQMYFLGQFAIGTDVHEEVLATFMLVCQGMVFMFSIPSMLNVVFSCNDAERLLSMPLTPITIFSAKITLVYLYELATSLIMSLFILLPYGIGAGLGVQFYLFLIFAIALLPLLPLLLMSIICFPFAYLTSYLQGKGFVKTILTTLFFLTIMGAYLFFMVSVMGMEGADQDMSFSDVAVLLVNVFTKNSQKIQTFTFFNYWLATAMVSNDVATILLNFLATVGTNGVALVLAVLLSSVLYKKMLAKSLEKTSQKTKESQFLQEKQSNKLFALAICDFKRLLRESQLGFQVLAMPILIPIIMVILCVSLTLDGEMGQVWQQPLMANLAIIFITFYNWLMGISGNVLALFPISRERSSFYLMKMMPVPLMVQLKAKLLLSTAMITISYLLTAIICVIILPIEWYFVFVLTLLPILFSFGSSCVTMLLDLRKPILDWTNFQTSLKNSANTWWTMLIAFCLLLVTLMVAGVFVLLYQSAQIDLFWLLYVVLVALGVVYCLVAYSILTKNSEKYFNRIEI